MALAAGTVFALGVCYFWPTMLGVTSERVPKGGALALALMGGIGMAIVGLVTSPMMGKIVDTSMQEMLPAGTDHLDTAKCCGDIPGIESYRQGEDRRRH